MWRPIASIVRRQPVLDAVASEAVDALLAPSAARHGGALRHETERFRRVTRSAPLDAPAIGMFLELRGCPGSGVSGAFPLVPDLDVTVAASRGSRRGVSFARKVREGWQPVTERAIATKPMVGRQRKLTTTEKEETARRRVQGGCLDAMRVTPSREAPYARRVPLPKRRL